MIEAPVRDHMQRNAARVPPSLTVRDLAERFAHEGITYALVMDADKLIGVVSEKDLILQELGPDEVKMPFAIPFLGDPFYLPGRHRFDDSFRKAFGVTVGDMMTIHPVTVREDQTVHEAARLLVEKDVPRLPVVDANGQVTGTIGRAEVVRALADLEFE